MAKLVQRLIHCTGNDLLAELLQQLPAEMRATILAEAVGGGAKIVVVAAKRYAKRSRQTGTLQASITHIVRKYPADGRAVAIVGPVVEGWGRSATRKATKGVTTPAVKYAHLVEFGHIIAKGGSLRPEYTKTLQDTGQSSKSGKAIKRWKRSGIKVAAKGRVGGWVPAKPFMRPAFVTTQAAVSAALAMGVSVGIEKVRRKLVREGAHAA